MSRSIKLRVWRWAVRLFDTVVLRLLHLWDWASPKARRRRKCLTPRFAYASRKSHRLEIHPLQQLTSYSCTASVLQAVNGYWTGQWMTHHRAIRLLKCYPDGAPLDKIARVLKGRLRCRSRRLRSVGQIQQAIRSGHPVIASDQWSYDEPHAILVTGVTARGFWTTDSAVGHRASVDEHLRKRSKRSPPFHQNSDPSLPIMIALIFPSMLAAAGYSLIYLLLGGGLGGAFLIFILAKMLGK